MNLFRSCDELGRMKDYLAIEKVRFGDKLRYEFKISTACEQFPVPTMIFQPLFENAIRHSVYESTEPVNIRFECAPGGRYNKNNCLKTIMILKCPPEEVLESDYRMFGRESNWPMKAWVQSDGRGRMEKFSVDYIISTHIGKKMRNFRTIIIEDEKPARDLLKAYLKEFEQVELLGEYDNGFDGLKAVNELKPDVIFLDVQMPKLTGFEMLEVLEHNPEVIFTTAYDQYAIKAFEQNAVDYLLKPFSRERFREAIERA